MSDSNTLPLKLPPELKGIISKEASKKDKGTIVFLLDLLTEHYKDELPKEAYERLKQRYSETRTEKRQKKRKRRLKALMVLGYSEEEAKSLADLSKEELKTYIESAKASAYNRQSKGGEQKLQRLTDDFIEQIGIIRRMKKGAPLSFKEKRSMLTEKLRQKLEEIRAVSEDTAMEFEERYKPELEGKR